MSAEQTFFNELNVIVTNSRFIANGQTFAMAQVSAVRADSDPWFRWSWALPLFSGGIFFGLGALLLLGSLAQGANSSSLACGMVFIMPGAALLLLGLLVFLNREHYVVVATSGGNISALASKDVDFIGRVVTAVGNALVYRG